METGNSSVFLKGLFLTFQMKWTIQSFTTVWMACCWYSLTPDVLTHIAEYKWGRRLSFLVQPKRSCYFGKLDIWISESRFLNQMTWVQIVPRDPGIRVQRQLIFIARPEWVVFRWPLLDDGWWLVFVVGLSSCIVSRGSRFVVLSPCLSFFLLPFSLS